MSGYLVEKYQDIIGINCTLDEIWDGTSTEVNIPDGSTFAVMEGESVTYYSAQYGVVVELLSTFPSLYSPTRYPVFTIRGLYTESSSGGFL